MQITHTQTYLTAMADSFISQRFELCHGITTHAEYLDRIDESSTDHLDRQFVAKVLRTTGRQRRRAWFKFDDQTLVICIPVKEPRTGQEIHAEMEYEVWLDLMEMGVHGAWFYAHKDKKRNNGQVRVKIPFHGSGGPTNASLTRIIADAEPGQRACVADGNPMNLRSSNVYLIGLPLTLGGKRAGSKTDTLKQIKGAVALREEVARKRRDLR